MVILEREKKPYRRKRCFGPRDNITTNMRPEDDDHRHRNEHQGTFWIFAWPDLIPWDRKIVPLLSPCGGRGWEVGDFWAVDEEGQLLIIENKTIRNRESPFRKFEHHQLPPVDELRRRWLTRLSQEISFRQAYPHGLECDMPSRSWPGLLDSSVGRMECRRYRHVYLDSIAPKFDSGEYRQLAEQYLDAYVKNGCPPPHYFGLFTLFDDDEVPRWVDDHGLMKQGDDRIHAFAVKRFPFFCYSSEKCEIRSYKVQVQEA